MELLQISAGHKNPGYPEIVIICSVCYLWVVSVDLSADVGLGADVLVDRGGGLGAHVPLNLGVREFRQHRNNAME